MATLEEVPAPSVAELALGFTEELRNDYRFGIREHAAVQQLLLELASRGQLPEDALGLEGHLRSILSSNRREHSEFAHRYREFLARQKPTVPRPRPPDVDQPWLDLRRVRVFVNGGVFLAIVAVLAIAFLRGRAPEPEPAAPTPAANHGGPAVPATPAVSAAPGAPATPAVRLQRELEQGSALIALSVLAVFALLLRAVWLRRQTAEFLARGPQKDQPPGSPLPDAETILFGIGAASSSSLEELRRAVRSLRARTASGQHELDVRETALASARNAGFVSEVFRERTGVPEYLFLIDRQHPHDFEAVRHDGVLDELAQNGVTLRRLYFDRRASVLWPRDPLKRSLSPDQLESAFASCRVGIFAGPVALFDPFTGGAAPWVSKLSRWCRPVLLTSETGMLGGRDPLEGFDVGVSAATLPGIARAFAGGDGAPRKGASEAQASLPSSVRAEQSALVSIDPPASALLSRCLLHLRWYLGSAGYFWLSACAFYPQLRWQLALELANTLGLLPSGVGSAETSRRLASLPWMRLAWMPNWLRSRLINDLPPSERERVRRALEQIFVAGAMGGSGVAPMEVLRDETSLARALFRALTRSWTRSDELPSPLEDRVFRRSMEDGLSVRLPRAVASIGHAIVRRARIDLPSRDWLHCAYGGLLLGYLSRWAHVLAFQQPSDDFPASTTFVVVAYTAAGIPATLSAGVPARVFRPQPSWVRSFAIDAGGRAFVCFATLYGASPLYPHAATTRGAITFAWVTAAFVCSLGLPLAVSKRPLRRVASIIVVLVGWVPVSFVIVLDDVMRGISPAPEARSPQAPLVYSLMIAVAASVLVRVRWSPLARWVRTLRDVADRFSLDRLLLDRENVKLLPPARLNTALAATMFGMIAGFATSGSPADGRPGNPLSGTRALGIALIAVYPYLSALRYQGLGTPGIRLRVGQEYLLLVLVAMAVRQPHEWLFSGAMLLAAAIHGVISLSLPRVFHSTWSFLDDTAPDRFLRTRPAYFGVMYLLVLVAAFMLWRPTRESTALQEPGSSATRGDIIQPPPIAQSSPIALPTPSPPSSTPPQPVAPIVPKPITAPVVADPPPVVPVTKPAPPRQARRSDPANSSPRPVAGARPVRALPVPIPRNQRTTTPTADPPIPNGTERRANDIIVEPSQPPAVSYVSVDASPYANIFIDGKKAGVTPLLRLRLEPGLHRLVARSEDGRTKRYTLNLERGQTETVKITWDE